MAYVPNSSPNVTPRLDILVFLTLIGTFLIWRWWSRREAAKIIVESPLLLSLYSDGVGLQSMAKGKISNMNYSLLMASAPVIETSMVEQLSRYGTDAAAEAANQFAAGARGLSNNGKIIMTLQLPFTSDVHLVCLGESDNGDFEQRAEYYKLNNLAKVTLEGDFPDFFTVLTRPGEQVALLEVVNPAIMAFLVDFCKRQDWELFGNALYFTQNNITPHSEAGKDTTNVVKDAQDFVARVLPTLTRMKPPVTQKQG